MPKSKLIVLLIFPIVVLIAAFPVVAQSDCIINPALPDILGSGCTAESSNIVARLLARFFATALAVGAVAFLLYLVYGAFRWLTGGADKANLEAAKATMTQALIGIILLASVFAVARIVGTLLGLGCEGEDFPDVICFPESAIEAPAPGPGLPPDCPPGVPGPC